MSGFYFLVMFYLQSSVGESPGKSGRKNIKKIKGKDDLEEATIEAAEEEKERRRRVEERQKLVSYDYSEFL